MSDFPDIKEELERKVTETLTQALQQLSEGETTPEITLAVLRALWGSAAGLVSKELMEMIADATDAIALEIDGRPRLRAFVKGDGLMLLEVPNERTLTTNMRQGRISKSITVTDDDMTLKEAMQRHHKTVAMLAENGYHE